MTRVLVVGHSHILALQRGARRRAAKHPDPAFLFQLLRDAKVRLPAAAGMDEVAHKAMTSSVEGVDQAKVALAIEQAAADVAVLCLNGNESAAWGLFETPALDHAGKEAALDAAIGARLHAWLDFLLPLLPPRVLGCTAPPPVGAEVLEGNFKPDRIARYAGWPLEPPAFRLRLWQRQCRIVREICEGRGIEFIDPPSSVLDAAGLLHRSCWSDEPTHGNEKYGRRMLQRLIEAIRRPPAAAPRADAVAVEAKPPPAADAPPAAAHPYRALPDSAFWKQSVSQPAPADVDPVGTPPFTVSPDDRVATAGSCFAQHISKRLRDSGFRFFVAEAARRTPFDFSARYGNVYTARQLLQLFDRAFGRLEPHERVWTRHGGGLCDPFRPRIEPAGFATEDELLADREGHLKAVRTMFEQLDVFVFTLGLTEAWTSRLDGAVYPLAPGVVGGQFDPGRHAFVNFTLRDTVADLEAFIARLEAVNASAKIILTVSPVPLVATASGRHVLTASTYSKSVLRVAAEEISRAYPHVAYFPSYEIITGPHAAGRYFEADRRSVTESGVDHVMRIFMSRMTTGGAAPAGQAARSALADLQAAADAACDEEMLAR